MDSNPQLPHSLSTTAIFVVMGVTGSGKTTIGKLLAERAGVVFADADDYHSEANKQKMAAGHPLTDADRQPWFVALNGLLLHWQGTGQGGVLACSALKASYRVTLTDGLPDGTARFILLDVPKEVLVSRLKARHHEFMNPDLLDSQIAILEAPSDEHTLAVKNDRDPDAVVAEILARTAERTEHTQGKEADYGASAL